MLDAEKLRAWLRPQTSQSADGRYWHAVLKEDLSQRGEILDQLRSYVSAAHEDARRRLRRLVECPSLDPIGSSASPDPQSDPAAGYPELLDMIMLKGYFGEVMAGIIAEQMCPLGHNWEVPAFLFRFHDAAFAELSRCRETGGSAGTIVGRSGDDCLAFERAASGEIVRCLVCEAKCRSDHEPTAISKAHRKVSEAISLPSDLLRLVEILRDYEDDTSIAWVDSLQRLYYTRSRGSPSHERCDSVTYVCGRPPANPSRQSWMPTDVPHGAYSGGRKLAAADVHLQDVESMVAEVYGGNSGNATTQPP